MRKVSSDLLNDSALSSKFLSLLGIALNSFTPRTANELSIKVFNLAGAALFKPGTMQVRPLLSEYIVLIENFWLLKFGTVPFMTLYT